MQIYDNLYTSLKYIYNLINYYKIITVYILYVRVQWKKFFYFSLSKHGCKSQSRMKMQGVEEDTGSKPAVIYWKSYLDLHEHN